MASITPELVHRMEQHLLEDPAIKQAKIIDLDPNGINCDLVVAISLTSPTPDDSAATRLARRSLVRKMRDAGGKAIVPRKWAQPADLPILTNGDIDEAGLRASLLLDASTPTEEVQPVMAESLDDKILGAVASALHMPQDQLVLSRSFAENGGDSFTAIQVFQSLMREGVSLRVPDIMRTPTLGELSSLVISRHGPSVPAPAPVTEVHEVHEVKLPDNQPVVAVTTVTV